ncbi:hypothetical protein PC114_g16530 [Phytophthora cactorum]|nr:hypothetical protein PC114_g16530 [Phytophthora cactorum]
MSRKPATAVALAGILTVCCASADLLIGVQHDATYSLPESRGLPCSGVGAEPVGTSCPNYGDVATSDCQPYLLSYNGAVCVAPVDAQCVLTHENVWGCAFPKTGYTSAAEAETIAAYDGSGSVWGSRYKDDVEVGDEDATDVSFDKTPDVPLGVDYDVATETTGQQTDGTMKVGNYYGLTGTTGSTESTRAGDKTTVAYTGGGVTAGGYGTSDTAYLTIHSETTKAGTATVHNGATTKGGGSTPGVYNTGTTTTDNTEGSTTTRDYTTATENTDSVTEGGYGTTGTITGGGGTTGGHTSYGISGTTAEGGTTTGEYTVGSTTTKTSEGGTTTTDYDSTDTTTDGGGTTTGSYITEDSYGTTGPTKETTRGYTSGTTTTEYIDGRKSTGEYTTGTVETMGARTTAYTQGSTAEEDCGSVGPAPGTEGGKSETTGDYGTNKQAPGKTADDYHIAVTEEAEGQQSIVDYDSAGQTTSETAQAPAFSEVANKENKQTVYYETPSTGNQEDTSYTLDPRTDEQFDATEAPTEQASYPPTQDATDATDAAASVPDKVELKTEKPCHTDNPEDGTAESPTKPPTVEVTTEPPTTEVTTEPPTVEVTTEPPTVEVTTEPPTTEVTTEPPTVEVTTEPPTVEVTTEPPTVEVTTQPPTTEVTTEPPTVGVTTQPPTTEVTTEPPTVEVTTQPPTVEVTTEPPTVEVTTEPPTTEVTTEPPTVEVTTEPPTVEVTTEPPTVEVTTEPPITQPPATQPPTTQPPTTQPPTTQPLTTQPPTQPPTTQPPTTQPPSTQPPTTQPPSTPCDNQGTNGIGVENKVHYNNGGIYMTTTGLRNDQSWHSCCVACWNQSICKAFSFEQTSSSSRCELTTSTSNRLTNQQNWQAGNMRR